MPHIELKYHRGGEKKLFVRILHIGDAGCYFNASGITDYNIVFEIHFFFALYMFGNEVDRRTLRSNNFYYDGKLKTFNKLSFKNACKRDETLLLLTLRLILKHLILRSLHCWRTGKLLKEMANN